MDFIKKPPGKRSIKYLNIFKIFLKKRRILKSCVEYMKAVILMQYVGTVMRKGLDR